MREQTIYSYQLLHRFRWQWPGSLVQLTVLVGTLAAAHLWLGLPLAKLIVSLAVFPLLPIVQFALFRLVAYALSQPTQLNPDMLVSAWWGAGTPYPVPLSFFRRAEAMICGGSLLIAAGLAVWLPPSYGIGLLTATIVVSLPRLTALAASLRQPARCRVKYENRSIAFLLTDG